MLVRRFLKPVDRNFFWSFWLFSIIVTINLIMTKKTIAVHFYEDIENDLASKNLTDSVYCDICPDFFEGKYKPFSPDLESKILKTFIIDLGRHLLKFLNEEKIQDGQQYNVYIINILFQFDDLAYFYKMVMSVPYLINMMNSSNYLLICKVMNIFKCIKNQFLEDFICSICVSLIFNSIKLEKSLLTKIPEIFFPGYITDIFIQELFKLHHISEETRNKIRVDPHEMIHNKYFQAYYINLLENYLYFDNDIVREFLKIHKRSKDFLKIFDNVLCFHTFKSIFLHNINYRSEYDKIFSLSIFKNIDEINVFGCLNTDFLLKIICQISSKKEKEALNIIDSNFNIRDEISFLKTLNFKIKNYIPHRDGTQSSFTDLNLNSPFHFIISKFIEEIYNYENKSNIFVVKTHKSCYDQEKKLTLEFKHDQRKILTFQNLEFNFRTFICMELINKHISFVFYIINLKEFKNIEMGFYDTNIKDFSLRKTEILNNITDIKIVRSTVNDIFLSKILLFPSLKSLFFYKCSIIISQNETIYKENTIIENFHFGSCLVNQQEFFQKFVNKMVALRDFVICCGGDHTNPFLLRSNNMMMDLSKLERLEFTDYYHPDRGIPFFLIFPNISWFYLDYNCPKSTLYKLFYNGNFCNLRHLKLYSVTIGKNDKLALEKNTNLLCLEFFYNCKILELAFSELFNPNNIYSLAEIKLPKIEFCKSDILFFSKLKSLKKLYIHGFTLKIGIIYFVKMFYRVREIEIEDKHILKDYIIEEFGDRLKRFEIR